MINVRVLDKQSFRNYCEHNSLHEKVIETSNCSVVCIDPTGGPDSDPMFENSHPNVLRVVFDDVEKDERKWGENVKQYFDAKAMTIEQGKSIVDFLKTVPNNNNLFIYCSRGKSRSGAVGVFATELYNQDLNEFLENNPQVGPNKFVLETLRELK